MSMLNDSHGWLPIDTSIRTSTGELPLKDIPLAPDVPNPNGTEIGVYSHIGSGWRIQPMEVAKRRLKTHRIDRLIKLTTRSNKQLLLSGMHLVPVWLPKNQQIKRGSEATHFVYLCLWTKYNLAVVGATDAYEFERLSAYSGEADYGPRHYWILATTNSETEADEKKIYFSRLFHSIGLASNYEDCDWRPSHQDIQLNKKLNHEFGEYRWLDVLGALGIDPAFPAITAAKNHQTLVLNSKRTEMSYPIHEVYDQEHGSREFQDLQKVLEATCFYNSPDYEKRFALSTMEGTPWLLPARNLFRGLLVGVYKGDRLLRHRVQTELVTKVEKVPFTGEVQSLEIPWSYNFFANDILVVNFSQDERTV